MKVSTKCNPVTVNVTYPRITFLLFLTSMLFFLKYLRKRKMKKKEKTKNKEPQQKPLMSSDFSFVRF